MDKTDKARMLINDPNLSNDMLDWYFEVVEQAVLEFTHRKDIPYGLGLLIIQIVAEYANARYSIEQASLPENQGQRQVSSITRGDTTISYGDKNTVTSGNDLKVEFSAADFVHDYKKRLLPYRKLKTL